MYYQIKYRATIFPTELPEHENTKYFRNKQLIITPGEMKLFTMFIVNNNVFN